QQHAKDATSPAHLPARPPARWGRRWRPGGEVGRRGSILCMLLGAWVERLSWAHIYVAAEWVVRVGLVLLILARKRRPAAALAWLALVLFEPLIGLFLYLLIGTIKLDPAHARRYAELRA